MINLNSILLLLSIHFFADFILQSDWMAINKSTKVFPLFVHVLLYSLCLLVFGWKFALINGLLHFTTDFITSKVTNYLWSKQKRHWFFVVIGFDQLLHYSALFVTFYYLGL